jgi:hypothetical protein
MSSQIENNDFIVYENMMDDIFDEDFSDEKTYVSESRVSSAKPQVYEIWLAKYNHYNGEEGRNGIKERRVLILPDKKFGLKAVMISTYEDTNKKKFIKANREYSYIIPDRETKGFKRPVFVDCTGLRQINECNFLRRVASTVDKKDIAAIEKRIEKFENDRFDNPWLFMQWIDFIRLNGNGSNDNKLQSYNKMKSNSCINCVDMSYFIYKLCDEHNIDKTVIRVTAYVDEHLSRAHLITIFGNRNNYAFMYLYPVIGICIKLKSNKIEENIREMTEYMRRAFRKHPKLANKSFSMQSYRFTGDDMRFWDYCVNHNKTQKCMLTSIFYPIELQKKLVKFKWGLYGTNGKFYENPSGDDYFKYYQLQTPAEFYEHKAGICWDYCEYQSSCFDKYNNLFEYKLWYIETEPMNTHTTMTFKRKGHDTVYWFESSWKPEEGIHEYKSESDFIKDFTARFMKEVNNDITLLLNYESPRKPLSCVEFADYVKDTGVVRLNRNADKVLNKRLSRLYFYHLISKTAKLDDKGLKSLQYLYDTKQYNLFDKNAEKYRDRICNIWHYYDKLPEELTREEIIKALNKERGKDGANRIYFFRFPPYEKLGPRMKEILASKDIYRINIKDPKVQKYLQDVDWGYEGSDNRNKPLDAEYYENITYSEYFVNYDDSVKMNFAKLNHISITPKLGYLPLSILEKVDSNAKESTDLEYAKQLSKKAEKGQLSSFVNYINPDSIDEPDNKENILEVVPMDLFMESELFDLDALDAAVEAGGPPELPKSNREEAIELFTKAYFGKYPVKYFPNNTDKKHDRIIGEITIPEAETDTAEKFLGEVIKKLNDKQSKFTFSYHDKYIFADIDTPKKEENKIDAKPASESMVLESTAGVMDFNNLYPINDFKDMALVRRYVNDFGLTLEQAVNTMEYFCLANPFLVLDAIDEDMYTSPEAYDNALLEAFCNAVKITGHQVDAYMENATSIDIYCEEATGKKDFNDKSFLRKIMNLSKPLSSKELAECDREVESALRKAKCPDVKYERTVPIIRELSGYSCGVLTLKVGGDKEDILKVIRQLNKDTKKYKYRAQRFTSSYLPVTAHFNIAWSYIIWVIDKKDPVDHNGSGINKPFTMENTIVDEAVKHPDGVDHTIQAGKDALKSGIKNVKNFVSKDPHTGRTGAEKMAHDAKKHVLSPLVSGIAKAYDELIGDSAEREEVIAGGLKGKLLKARRLFLKVILAYKTPVLLSALVASGFGTPAAILIKIVGWIAGFAMATHTGIADSSANETKNTVIAELELELKIVREKIEDAKSAGDTKAKYELMRTENKIEMEIYRIKFGKYPRKSSKL